MHLCYSIRINYILIITKLIERFWSFWRKKNLLISFVFYCLFLILHTFLLWNKNSAKLLQKIKLCVYWLPLFSLETENSRSIWLATMGGRESGPLRVDLTSRCVVTTPTISARQPCVCWRIKSWNAQRHSAFLSSRTICPPFWMTTTNRGWLM